MPRFRYALLFVITLTTLLLATRSHADETWPAPATMSLDPPVLLPDGTEFTTWEDTTEYTRVYHVDQNHPNASDENDGSPERPLKTIQAAAERVQPGEKVLIHPGVYRECVRPVRGGTGPDKMIAFEGSLDGGNLATIITGAEPVPGPWVESRIDGRQVSKSLWMTDLPDEMFEGENPEEPLPFPLKEGIDEPGFPSAGNPFRTPLASEKDISIMPWAKEWAGKLPYTLPRGMVYRPTWHKSIEVFPQVAAYEDMLRVMGTYWIEPQQGGVRVHMLPWPPADPNESVDDATYEVSVRQQLFKPMKPGLGYIKIKGLFFLCAGNGLPRSGNGAVTTHGGHHWIIDLNLVEACGSVGIEIGAKTNEFYEEGERKELEQRSGYHIVRSNIIRNSGTGGIQGHTVFRSLVDGNVVVGCGWQEVERYWETAGIKMLNVTDSLVQDNGISEIAAACGIWLDFLNVNCRVTRNEVYDVTSYHGGIFLEASQVPNMIDTNVIYNIDGHGIYMHDTDRAILANNLIVGCSEDGIRIQVCKNRNVGGRISTCVDNRVAGNVIVDCKNAMWFLVDENASEGNVISNCPGFDLAKWRERGLGATDIEADLGVDTRNGFRKISQEWPPKQSLPLIPRLPQLTHDFIGQPLTSEEIAPGPGSLGEED